jgi:hypothetical protein
VLTSLEDCSGSTNAGLGWLQRAGYPLAKDDLDESYHPHMRYSTCVFQTDPDVVAKIKPPHIGTDTVSLGFFFPVQWLDSRHFAIEHLEGGKRELISFTRCFTADRAIQS